MHAKNVILILFLSAWAFTFSTGRTNAMESGSLYHYRAIITAVYDGDTVTADVDLGFNIWLRQIKLRLLHIDAPEIRSSNRDAAIKARDFLRQRLLGKPVIIKTLKDKKGKYGRYLAEIWLHDENINASLVKKGHAVARIY